jgi:hypothetical protein
MTNLSRLEIEKWTRIIDKTGGAGVERLRGYICSRMLGRDFLESVDTYFERRGISEFYQWAQDNYLGRELS